MGGHERRPSSRSPFSVAPESAPAAPTTAPGEVLRPLVQPLTLFGKPIEERAYAVEAGDGKQIRLFHSEGVKKSQLPSESEIQLMLSSLADSYERAPGGLSNNAPNIEFITQQEAGGYGEGAAGSYAFVRGGNGPPTIYVVGKNGLRIRKGNDRHFLQNTQAGLIAHEYGHLHYSSSIYLPAGERPLASQGAMFKAIKAMPKNGGMSSYGLTNPDEAYAEAFSEWMMTNGETKIPAVIAYAEAFAWPTPAV